jgi:hypothetical protein
MAVLSFVLYRLGAHASENGFIENVQVAVLAVAFVLWLVSLKDAVPFKEDGFHPLFAAFFALLAYIVMGRELTWLEVVGLPEAQADLLELCSVVIALVLLLSFALIWLLKVTNRSRILKHFLLSETFKLALISLFFVLLGDAFEKNLFHVNTHQFFEEMAELTGYLFIMLSAIVFRKQL